MNTADNPNEQNFEEASAQLDEGLRSCRAVISGYRALLSDEGGAVEAPVNDTRAADKDAVA